jgi:hypothetical protein
MDIVLTNPVYNTILSLYRTALAQSRYPSQAEIVNHPDAEVCTVAVDLLTIDDNYTESAIWSQKDMRTLSQSNMLAEGIPKLIWLYKSRIIMGRIAELNAMLATDLDEEQMYECLKEYNRMNQLKVQIANHLGRTII